MGVPGVANVVGLADLARVTPGVRTDVTVALSWSVTAGPVGGVPVTVPVLVIDPLSRSAWVVV